VSKSLARHLRVGDTVDGVLEHPAFAGFARLLLPWDDGRYDTTMPLRDIDALLPYHTQVDPWVVVSSLNRMIDEANAGRRDFYDIYGDTQRQEELSRKDTGLFFFRGKSGAPFAVIAPGGGFAYVGSVHEGFPFAVEISSRGYNAFVLNAAPDMAQDRHGGPGAALSYIFRNAVALAWRHGLFAVGQLRGREDGRGDRFLWRRTVWRLGPA
jgi:hypothetical protein